MNMYFNNIILIIILQYIHYVVTYKNVVLDEIDIEAKCATRKCLRKCCPKDEYFVKIDDNNSCQYNKSEKLDFSNVPIYDDNDLEKKLNNKFQDTFYLIPNLYNEEQMVNGEKILFLENSFELSELTMLSLNGILYNDFQNALYRWTPYKLFCIEYIIGTEEPIYMVWYSEEEPKPNVYFKSALGISSVFLFLVLLVYSLLPELRNLVGLILMAYVFSMLGAFLFLLAMQVNDLYAIECIILTAITYFFFISTFCWMNVMSYDIWWTFRGYAKARPIHRRGEKFKFLMYCAYAWGVPLLMAIMLVVINSLDLSSTPWFVKPQIPIGGCFLEGGQKLVYLYIPMLILIFWNWFFFLMTAFNIWRLSRATAVVNSDAAGNPAAHRSQKNRLMIYLKLSLIMGVNWVLEVVSYFSPDSFIWKFTDMYNLLMGFAIFMIFVCKKKIYIQLRNRYLKKQLRKSHESSSTIESSLSQETPLQISTHPMGLKSKPI